MSESTFPHKLHPIQMVGLNVRNLSIRSNRPPSPDIGLDNENEAVEGALSIGYSDYDAELKQIGIAVKLHIGEGTENVDDPKTPYELVVELRGAFSVDENYFPMDRLDEWASKNGSLILMPHLRDHVYALTLRAGFRPLLLPLFEVPTFKI